MTQIVIPLGNGDVGISYLTDKQGKHCIGFSKLEKTYEVGRNVTEEESSDQLVLIELNSIEGASVLKKIVDHAISRMGEYICPKCGIRQNAIGQEKGDF